MRTRLALGALGLAGLGYGGLYLLSRAGVTHPRELGAWLVGGVVLHDGVLAPLTLLAGAVSSRWLPGRGRRYAQGTALAIALVALPALVLVYRHGSQPAPKALLRQDYAGHLLLIAGVLAAVGLCAYLLRVVRDQRTRRTNDRPPDAQDSDST